MSPRYLELQKKSASVGERICGRVERVRRSLAKLESEALVVPVRQHQATLWQPATAELSHSFRVALLGWQDAWFPPEVLPSRGIGEVAAGAAASFG